MDSAWLIGVTIALCAGLTIGWFLHAFLTYVGNRGNLAAALAAWRQAIWREAVKAQQTKPQPQEGARLFTVGSDALWVPQPNRNKRKED